MTAGPPAGPGGDASLHSERLIIRAFALIRAFTLAQTAVALVIDWRWYRWPGLIAALLAAAAVQSLLVLRLFRRRNTVVHGPALAWKLLSQDLGIPSAGPEQFAAQNPAPLGWLNDTQLVMLWGSQLYIVTFGHGYRSATAGHGLLPPSSNQYLQAMLSPDHRTLAFTTGNDLWELALNQPGAQPKKVGTLGSSSVYWAILDWR